METFLYSTLAGMIIVLGFAVAAAVPAILVVVGHKKGIYWFAGISVMLAALTVPFIGIGGAVAVLLMTMPFSYMILYCMQQKTSIVKTAAVSVFVLLLMAAASYFVLRNQLEEDMKLLEDLAKNLEPYVRPSLELIYEEIDDASAVELTLQYITMSIPAELIGTALLISVLTYIMSASFINKTEENEKKVRYIPFEMWDIPSNVGCFVSVGLAVVLLLSSMFEWADVLIEIAMMIYFLLMGIQGASFIIFFQKKYRMPAVPAWMILCLLIAVTPLLVILLGIADKLFRIKLTYYIKKGIIKVRRVDPRNFANGRFSKFIDENGKIVDDTDERQNEEDEGSSDEDDDNDNDNDSDSE